MFKNLTYKQKFRLTMLVIVLFFLIAYRLSIKKTFEQKAVYKELSKNYSSIDRLPQAIASYQKSLQDLESVLGVKDSSGIEFRELLLEQVGVFCKEKGLSIIDFPEADIISGKDYHIITNPIVTKGSFHDQVLLLNFLEKEKPIGSIAGVCYELNEEKLTKKQRLLQYIYLQQIIKIPDEK
jgi:hypothetical protein